MTEKEIVEIALLRGFKKSQNHLGEYEYIFEDIKAKYSDIRPIGDLDIHYLVIDNLLDAAGKYRFGFFEFQGGEEVICIFHGHSFDMDEEVRHLYFTNEGYLYYPDLKELCLALTELNEYAEKRYTELYNSPTWPQPKHLKDYFGKLAIPDINSPLSQYMINTIPKSEFGFTEKGGEQK